MQHWPDSTLPFATGSFRTKTPELKEAFSKFGEISSCTVCKQPGGESRGFGFVNFTKKGQ
jgi:RNA recognition motif-containing protein